VGLSFNQISELPQPLTKCLPIQLVSIDLSWNCLSNMRMVIKALLPFENRLKILCLLGNPLVLMGARYKPRILNSFPRLSVLDDNFLDEHRDPLAGLKYDGDLSSAQDETLFTISINLQLVENGQGTDTAPQQSTAAFAPPAKKGKDAAAEPV
jgi:hypothetical protein